MSETAAHFIGRQREINWLKDAWLQVRVGQPHVCVLRGESGFGKTRLVQAFYSWLSSHPDHDPQAYWPDVLLKEGSNLRLNPPAASFGEVKVLPWLWWGVRWNDPGVHNQGELSTYALIDGLHHLEPHRQALMAGRLRTTNALERINGEFRRRTKTQASLPGQDAVLLLLFGLLRTGQVKLRKIDGWQEMAPVKEAA